MSNCMQVFFLTSNTCPGCWVAAHASLLHHVTEDLLDATIKATYLEIRPSVFVRKSVGNPLSDRVRSEWVWWGVHSGAQDIVTFFFMMFGFELHSSAQ